MEGHPIAPPTRFGFGGFCLLVSIIAFAVQQGCSVTGNRTSWAWGVFWFLFVAVAAIAGVWIWDHTAKRHWLEKTIISVFLLLFVGRFSYDPIIEQYKREHPPEVVRQETAPNSAPASQPPQPVQEPEGKRETPAARSMPEPERQAKKEQAKTVEPPPASTPVIVSAPNGIAVGGGTVTNPIVNNFGPRPPQLEWKVSPRIDPLPPDSEQVKEYPSNVNPGVNVTITVAGRFIAPMFAVRCDHACFTTGIGIAGASSPRTYTTNRPDVAMAGFGGIPGQIEAGSVVKVTVRSGDSSDVKVLEVFPYVPPQ
jgi:hypothetical protein